MVSWVVRDWQAGAILTYSSGAPIMVPFANNQINSLVFRAASPAPGQFGTSAAYYNDYRGPRRPSENFNLGRTFRLVERVSFSIRAEFSNIFNRAYFQFPASTNASATQRILNGQTVSGFGYINTATSLAATFAAAGPRSGTVVARFSF